MNTKQTEALKLAQDLRVLADRFSEGWHEGIKIDALDIELLANAAEALAEQPAQQEPVAWEYCEEIYAKGNPELNDYIRANGIPLYTTPQAQPAHQEPVAWRVKVETKLRDGSVDFGYQLRNERLSKYDEPLYTFPPASKPWVGLTDEERREIGHPYFSSVNMSDVAYARAIEAKLREKNA